MVFRLKYAKTVIVAVFAMCKDYFKGVTKLQALNWILQFLFFRVFRIVVKGKTTSYGVMYPIFPLTGWINSFWTLGIKIRFKIIYKCQN